MPVNPATGNPATSVNPGGTDTTIPVTFADHVVPTIVDFGEEYIPEYRWNATVQPTYHALDVRGPSALYTQQKNNYGLVNMKITYARLTGTGGPAFARIICDGVEYVIQVGQVVQVPKCVYDVTNASSDYGAILV